MIRICTKCKKPKNLETEFYKAKGYRDGYFAQCKECQSKHPSQLPEENLKGLYERRQRNRQFVWDYYTDHPCVDCGEDDPVVLEMDHVRGTKLDNVSKLVHNTRSIKIIKEEIAKCDVICANCHRRRTAATQEWYTKVT